MPTEGYKRYWVVINVKHVALKTMLAGSLANQSLHATLLVHTLSYLKRNYNRESSKQSLRYFNCAAKKNGIASDKLWLNVSCPSSRRATTKFTEDRSFKEITSMLHAVYVEAYFQQHGQGKVGGQLRGLPIGGKCCADLANLYHCAVEPEYIDLFIVLR